MIITLLAIGCGSNSGSTEDGGSDAYLSPDSGRDDEIQHDDGNDAHVSPDGDSDGGPQYDGGNDAHVSPDGDSDGGPQYDGGNDAHVLPDGASSGGCENRFTHAIIDPKQLFNVTPIGSVGAGGTEIIGRSYMFPRSDLTTMDLPLYAPTDMTLIGGVRYIPQGAPDGYTPDWALYFVTDCDNDVAVELYHIKGVIPSIEDAVGTTPEASSAWRTLPMKDHVHFEAGEPFGYYRLGLNSVAWDFIVHDHGHTNTFTNQERYEAQQTNLLHIVCPYSFFTEDVRAAYEDLLGAPGTGPIEGTTCGSVSVDVVGAIAGQWFLSDDASQGFGPLSLENGYGNPHPIAQNADDSITFGNIGPSLQGFRIYTSNPTWTPPSMVTDEHCYQLYDGSTPNGWLFYKVVSDTEMKLHHSATGTCPDDPPLSGGRSYYR